MHQHPMKVGATNTPKQSTYQFEKGHLCAAEVTKYEAEAVRR